MRPTHCGLVLTGATAIVCALIVLSGSSLAMAGAGDDTVATGIAKITRTSGSHRFHVLRPPSSGYSMRWSRDENHEVVRVDEYVRTARVTVGLSEGVDARKLAAGYGLALMGTDRVLRIAILAGTPGPLNRLGDALNRDRRLRYLSNYQILRFRGADERPDVATTDPDTGVPREWAFGHVGADRALELSPGSPNIVVGVVDSGVGDVPDLAGKIVSTWRFSAGVRDAVDTNGHGTIVSSIIAARDDDGHGLSGYCGACRLDVVRLRPIQGFSNFQLAVAIRRLVDDGVRIINLSLGFDPAFSGREFDDFTIVDALSYAIAHGVLVVAAAGNERRGHVGFPASFLQPAYGAAGYGLAVGASDQFDRRALFSNWGAHLSLLAPGSFKGRGCTGGIWAVLPTPAPAWAISGKCGAIHVDPVTHAHYTYASGTSFAAPEVAGVAALVWAARPGLTAKQVAAIIEVSATRPAGTGWTAARGWGVLNAERAVELATGRR